MQHFIGRNNYTVDTFCVLLFLSEHNTEKKMKIQMKILILLTGFTVAFVEEQSIHAFLFGGDSLKESYYSD